MIGYFFAAILGAFVATAVLELLVGRTVMELLGLEARRAVAMNVVSAGAGLLFFPRPA